MSYKSAAGNLAKCLAVPILATSLVACELNRNIPEAFDSKAYRTEIVSEADLVKSLAQYVRCQRDFRNSPTYSKDTPINPPQNVEKYGSNFIVGSLEIYVEYIEHRDTNSKNPYKLTITVKNRKGSPREYESILPGRPAVRDDPLCWNISYGKREKAENTLKRLLEAYVK